MTRVFTRSSVHALCAGFFISAVSTAAVADQRCQQLEELHRQYAGVQLTSSQQKLKVRLVAWYQQNCARTRRASVGR